MENKYTKEEYILLVTLFKASGFHNLSLMESFLNEEYPLAKYLEATRKDSYRYHAYNEFWGTINEPLENMPLYINETISRTDENDVIVETGTTVRNIIANWRLQIGK